MGQKILVVEDNELNLKLFCDLLRAHGYEAEPVRDGRDALARARAFTPDLVVMDIQMPYVSGLELIEQMKSDEGLRRTPVMAVTAYAAKGDEERIRDAGAEGYVSKPISVAKFVQAVAGLLAAAAARPAGPEPEPVSEPPPAEPEQANEPAAPERGLDPDGAHRPSASGPAPEAAGEEAPSREGAPAPATADGLPFDAPPARPQATDGGESPHDGARADAPAAGPAQPPASADGRKTGRKAARRRPRQERPATDSSPA